VAPLLAIQIKLKGDELIIVPDAGDDKNGATGEGPDVVKLHTDDHGDVPAEFAALTLQ
jgi:hypothetical protein